MADEGAPTVDVTDPAALDRAAAALRAGQAIIVPTDTVYGLAALPTVAGATDRLFALKDRSEGQPVAVLVADAEQAMALIAPPIPEVERWMRSRWPGPLTIVAARSDGARDLELGGSPDTIGVRCPDHDFVRALATRVGPIATTSANRHGEPTPTEAAAAADALVGPVALVIDGGTAGTVASTVVDASAQPWRVLRVGAVAQADLQ